MPWSPKRFQEGDDIHFITLLGFKGPHFWERRYYDFNVWTERKRVEKLRYTHRNPVTRGLVEKPEDWPWGSFRHYLSGEQGTVEIESEWTARRRERMGAVPVVTVRYDLSKSPTLGKTG